MTGENTLISLAGPANKQGRVAADNICGGDSRYLGAQGSSVVKVCELTVAATGLNERRPRRRACPMRRSYCLRCPTPGIIRGKLMTMKVLYEKGEPAPAGGPDCRPRGVDKRIDVLATAMQAGLPVTALKDLDLAYAPPYASARPGESGGIHGGKPGAGGGEAVPLGGRGWAAPGRSSATLLDARTPGEYSGGCAEGFVNVPLDELRDRLGEIAPGKPVYVMCQSGLRSYLACRILAQNGYDCYNFSGGYRSMRASCWTGGPGRMPIPAAWSGPEQQTPPSGFLPGGGVCPLYILAGSGYSRRERFLARGAGHVDDAVWKQTWGGSESAAGGGGPGCRRAGAPSGCAGQRENHGAHPPPGLSDGLPGIPRSGFSVTYTVAATRDMRPGLPGPLRTGQTGWSFAPSMAFPPGSFSITSGPWAGGLFSWSPTRGPSPPWWENCSGRALGPLPQRAPSRGCGPLSPMERTGRCPGRRWRRCPPGNCLWPRFIRPIAGCSGSGAGWTMTIRWCTRRRFSGGMGEILAYFQEKYTHLCVDEAQDTSPHSAYHSPSAGGRRRNLFLVGDEDQSIYGFRAAEPGALLRFERDYPGGRVLFLEKNYRSTQTIVTAADGFIRQNHNRRDKHMTAARGPGPALEELWVYDRAAQYAYLARLARDCQQETAVLYRNNESALPVLDLLDRQGIACRCRQMDGTFFTHRVVRDMADFFTFAVNPADGACFLRMYYKLRAGITKGAAQWAVQTVGAGGEPAGCAVPVSRPVPVEQGPMPGPSPSTLPGCGGAGDWAVDRLRHAMGYGEYLKERGGDLGKLDILEALGRHVPNLGALLDRLEELRTLVRQERQGPAQGLILSTIHASKGLEYQRVILMDVADGLLPLVEAPVGRNPDPAAVEAYEEERRLFYVGMTRAKETLAVFRFQKPGLASAFSEALFPQKPSPSRSGPIRSRRGTVGRKGRPTEQGISPAFP